MKANSFSTILTDSEIDLFKNQIESVSHKDVENLLRDKLAIVRKVTNVGDLYARHANPKNSIILYHAVTLTQLCTILSNENIDSDSHKIIWKLHDRIYDHMCYINYVLGTGVHPVDELQKIADDFKFKLRNLLGMNKEFYCLKNSEGMYYTGSSPVNDEEKWTSDIKESFKLDFQASFNSFKNLPHMKDAKIVKSNYNDYKEISLQELNVSSDKSKFYIKSGEMFLCKHGWTFDKLEFYTYSSLDEAMNVVDQLIMDKTNIVEIKPDGEEIVRAVTAKSKVAVEEKKQDIFYIIKNGKFSNGPDVDTDDGFTVDKFVAAYWSNYDDVLSIRDTYFPDADVYKDIGEDQISLVTKGKKLFENTYYVLRKGNKFLTGDLKPTYSISEAVKFVIRNDPHNLRLGKFPDINVEEYDVVAVHVSDHKTLNFKIIYPGIEEKKGNPKMSIMNEVTEAAEEAQWRVYQRQAMKRVKDGIFAMLKKSGKSEVQLAKKFFDSRIGEGLLCAAIGFGGNRVPMLADNPKFSRLMKEFKVEGMAVVGDDVVERAVGALLPMFSTTIFEGLDTLPEVKKVRVKAQADEDDEEESGERAEKIMGMVQT